MHKKKKKITQIDKKLKNILHENPIIHIGYIKDKKKL